MCAVRASKATASRQLTLVCTRSLSNLPWCVQGLCKTYLGVYKVFVKLTLVCTRSLSGDLTALPAPQLPAGSMQHDSGT